jgi:hypothetical protein
MRACMRACERACISLSLFLKHAFMQLQTMTEARARTFTGVIDAQGVKD